MSHSLYQRGVALLVSLIMLIVVTLLGITSIRTVIQEERMTGNTYDRSLGFQAAEAALRAGESLAQSQSQTVPANAGFPAASGVYSDATSGACPNNYFTDTSLCSNGLCKTPDVDCAGRWEDSTFDGWMDATALSLGSVVSGTPQFFVEYLGGNFPCMPDTDPTTYLSCSRYRITARSAADGRATVILQSIYATE